MRTLIIDNYDSFTYNLAQLVAKVSGLEPLVVLNDQMDWSEVVKNDFSQIILSPGPGRPERDKDFGLCRDAIRDGRWPILGVCLGHQGIAHAVGGRVVHAPVPMHGRLSYIVHDQSDLFEGLPSPFEAVRYHSLITEALPPELQVTAWTEDKLIMGFRHRSKPLWGVQFHPESIATEHGDRLMANFLRLARGGQEANTDLRSHTAKVKMSKPVTTTTKPLRLFHRVVAAGCTSEVIFTALYQHSRTAVWLDSSSAIPESQNFSFMADDTGPFAETVHYQMGESRLTGVAQGEAYTLENVSVFDHLERRLATLKIESDAALPFDFNTGFIGYFGYELKAETGGQAVHRSRYPDAQFLFADRVIAFDHSNDQVWLMCCDEAENAERAFQWIDNVEKKIFSATVAARFVESHDLVSPSLFTARHDDEQYIENIRNALGQIHDGETYEVCLTNEFSGDSLADGLGAYRILRNMNPAPYSAYLRMGGIEVLCSSPERFVRISSHGVVESKPIKGTLRRGATPEEDQALREKLRNSEKDRSENLMIVDLIRNDLGRVCETGSVSVPKLFDVESYATVHQLVSTIIGRLRSNCNAMDCIRALFPGGSMTGAPKIRTLELLDHLEKGPRGIYSGALGYFSVNGAADFNIVIRTIVLDDTTASIGVGGAIVALSDPQAELDEIKLKSAVLLRAFEAARAQAVSDVMPRAKVQVSR